jgi:C-terminal processing protease CtpA/Prc
VTPKGRRLELNGVEPDVKVARTLADLRAGRDADLETALRVLAEQR